MLAKKNRLTKKRDFESIFKKGKSFKEDFLILRTLERNSEEIRFGFIVSQKISKKAAIRNKIKRQISELVRKEIPKLKKGIDGLFITLPGIEKKDFWEIEENLSKLFLKAKLLHDQRVDS